MAIQNKIGLLVFPHESSTHKLSTMTQHFSHNPLLKLVQQSRFYKKAFDIIFHRATQLTNLEQRNCARCWWPCQSCQCCCLYCGCGTLMSCTCRFLKMQLLDSKTCQPLCLKSGSYSAKKLIELLMGIRRYYFANKINELSFNLF